jgi:hypothetical protein
MVVNKRKEIPACMRGPGGPKVAILMMLALPLLILTIFVLIEFLNS